ncbi:MAG: hypothetical protein N2170_08400 [Bacteroidia bacterium]|nr:hypothetical protein [Bacteroidia bacterium]
MESLYIGTYRWPLVPPLRLVRRGQGRLAVFLSDEDTTSEALSLLEKITAAIHCPPEGVSVWAAGGGRLTRERLALFAEKVMWVMGEKVLSFPLSRGAYTLPGLQPLAKLPSEWPSTPILYLLPSLSTMMEEQDAKRFTWRCIQGLGSPS